MRRGPYVIAAGLAESIPNAKPYVLHGLFLNLFAADQPILTRVSLTPGRRLLLVDLYASATASEPRILAAACRIRKQESTPQRMSFLADGIADTVATIRIRTQSLPIRVLAAGKALSRADYQMDHGILRIQLQNSPQPIPIEITFDNQPEASRSQTHAPAQ